MQPRTRADEWCSAAVVMATKRKRKKKAAPYKELRHGFWEQFILKGCKPKDALKLQHPLGWGQVSLSTLKQLAQISDRIASSPDTFASGELH